MARRPRDEDFERRLTWEIIIEAKPKEQSIGWYYYFEEHLRFPFQALCIAERAAKNEVFPRFGRRRRWFGRTRRTFRGADTCADGLAEQGSVASVPGTKASSNLVLLATDEDLDRLDELLSELREFSQLRERKRGSFSRGSHAFLHFHEGAGEFYVDVKLNRAFERMKVTSRAEQAAFLREVEKSLQASPPSQRLPRSAYLGSAEGQR
jgi:hypothetical protein